MRLMSTQCVAITAVLLILSLSAGAAMVFGDADRDKDKDKDRSSVGGGSLSTLDADGGGPAGAQGELGTPLALGRSGWVLPAGGLIADGLSACGGPLAWRPTAIDVPEPRPERRRRSTPSDTPSGEEPAPNPQNTVLIPEPATLALVSLGGLALLVRHRRRC